MGEAGVTQVAALILVVAGCAAVLALLYRRLALRARRRAFIDDYAWPQGLLDRFRKRRPGLSRAETARVEEGLRRFFHAYLAGGRRFVAMPSQAADDLWHEFILHTRAYEAFCDQAFGGFLHHTPALALAPAQAKSNAGLRRVWRSCCAQEGINPLRPERLPLLFALDAEMNIADGFHYATDCKALRDRGVAAPYCGGDFSDSGFDGSTDGLNGSSGHHAGGDGGHHAGADSGGDAGSSDGGSCGGGSCGGGD
jgi:hypothetical protein